MPLAVQEVLGFKTIKRWEIPEAHQELINDFKQDIISNSNFEKGVYLSDKYYNKYIVLKNAMYGGFHKWDKREQYEAKCLKRLGLVTEHVRNCISNDYDEKMEFASIIKNYLERLNYQGISSTLIQKRNDFITGYCTDLIVKIWYKELTGEK